MISHLIVSLAVLWQGSPAPKSEPEHRMKTFQFVMFKRGNGTLPQEESQRALKAHLAGLEELWLKQGKAVLLGPMADPGGDLRGILVLDTSAEEAKRITADDPFIKAGVMSADIRPLMAAEGYLQKPPKFMDLMAYTLGFFKRPEGAALPKLSDEETNRLQKDHVAHNVQMWTEGHLVWAGPFLESTDLRGILVFRTTDLKKIEEMLKQDPLVKAGRLAYELHPAMTAKGAFPAPSKQGS